MRSLAQGARFCAVGASGYLVNLGVSAIALDTLGLHYLFAASLAFGAAVSHNFVLNRGWTFAARERRARGQAARFVPVSLASLAVGLGVLHLLVDAGFGELAAQAVSVAVVAPLNFVWNRRWTFAPEAEAAR